MFGRRLLEMTWRDGLFVHWPVDPGVIEPTLPDRLSVDTHDGDAYLGVVPFVMEDIRPRGSPIGLSFAELNLRTYVDGPNGPGVYFYSLDADDPIGVTLARRLFALPYYRARITVRRERLDVDEAATDEPDTATDRPRIHFRSRRVHGGAPPAPFDATYEPTEPEGSTPEPGSLPAFLVENYRFYAAGSRLYCGEIDHEPWTLREGTVTVRRNGLFEANGFEQPGGEPLVHFADPLEVTADRIRAV